MENEINIQYFLKVTFHFRSGVSFQSGDALKFIIQAFGFSVRTIIFDWRILNYSFCELRGIGLLENE